MTSVEFCYWLQGFFELDQPSILTVQHVECIKRHVSLTEEVKHYDSPRQVK